MFGGISNVVLDLSNIDLSWKLALILFWCFIICVSLSKTKRSGRPGLGNVGRHIQNQDLAPEMARDAVADFS